MNLSAARAWSGLSPIHRRRILLACLLPVALAARDVVLFLFTAALFALSELAPAPRRLTARA